jgi:hypothetical protein
MESPERKLRELRGDLVEVEVELLGTTAVVVFFFVFVSVEAFALAVGRARGRLRVLVWEDVGNGLGGELNVEASVRESITFELQSYLNTHTTRVTRSWKGLCKVESVWIAETKKMTPALGQSGDSWPIRQLQ